VNNFNLNNNETTFFNIRSVNANFDELLLYLENYINYKKIDIVILTETCHSVENCVLTIPGYNTYNSSTKRKHFFIFIHKIKDTYAIQIVLIIYVY